MNAFLNDFTATRATSSDRQLPRDYSKPWDQDPSDLTQAYSDRDEYYWPEDGFALEPQQFLNLANQVNISSRQQKQLVLQQFMRLLLSHFPAVLLPKLIREASYIVDDYLERGPSSSLTNAQIGAPFFEFDSEVTGEIIGELAFDVHRAYQDEDK